MNNQFSKKNFNNDKTKRFDDLIKIINDENYQLNNIKNHIEKLLPTYDSKGGKRKTRRRRYKNKTNKKRRKSCCRYRRR
jgi:hypothetical protein